MYRPAGLSLTSQSGKNVSSGTTPHETLRRPCEHMPAAQWCTVDAVARKPGRKSPDRGTTLKPRQAQAGALVDARTKAQWRFGSRVSSSRSGAGNCGRSAIRGGELWRVGDQGRPCAGPFVQGKQLVAAQSCGRRPRWRAARVRLRCVRGTARLAPDASAAVLLPRVRPPAATCAQGRRGRKHNGQDR